MRGIAWTYAGALAKWVNRKVAFQFTWRLVPNTCLNKTLGQSQMPAPETVLGMRLLNGVVLWCIDAVASAPMTNAAMSRFASLCAGAVMVFAHLLGCATGRAAPPTFVTASSVHSGDYLADLHRAVCSPSACPMNARFRSGNRRSLRHPA